MDVGDDELGQGGLGTGVEALLALRDAHQPELLLAAQVAEVLLILRYLANLAVLVLLNIVGELGVEGRDGGAQHHVGQAAPGVGAEAGHGAGSRPLRIRRVSW